ncbi:MAG: apolipoprotein N-acyltransferase [Pseudomonadota bacterium]
MTSLRYRLLLLPPLLGALAVPGFAPLGAWPLPILSLALLFWWVRGASPRSAFLAGWGYGLGLFLAGVSWVFVSLSTYGGLPAPVAAIATLLFCAFIALFPALALGLAIQLAPNGWARPVLALPAAWVLMEWVRGWFLTGFPWLAFGYSQVPDSPLAGFAPLLGVYGVSLVVALVAGLFASRRANFMTAGVLLLVAGYGLQQVAWTLPVVKPVSVALVQGNVPQEMKFRPEKVIVTLEDYARQVFSTRARLVVLPETAVPVFRSGVPQDYLDGLASHVRQQNGDLLVGLPEDTPSGQYYNAVASFGSAPEGSYRKHHLVPFGEFVPFGFRWLVDMMHIPLGDFARGAPDQGPIAAAGEKLAVNVCYEDAFGEERIHAARDATMLVNVSNDAWFGNSLSPRQHLQIGAMRSLEAGRWQLRANNTGITAILDEKGRVRAELPPFVQATLEGNAQGMAGLTPYLRWGNGPVLIILAALLALSSLISRKRAPHE